MTLRFAPLPGGTPRFQHSNLDDQSAGIGIQPPQYTELNYDDPPKRVPRMFSLGIAYYNGLMQHGFVQTFSGVMGAAFLPPPNVAQALARGRGYRAVGGVLGAGTVSAAGRHIPAVRVPRSVS